jgi:CheY-like chemotaxis protein
MPNHTAKTTLLLVDDDVQLRLLLTMILDHVGYDVRVAEDGFSALRNMRDDLPDTILSDLNMPGMSGFELLSVVRRRFPEIRVIAMSGAFSGHEIPAGVAADAFYHKGSDLEDLLALLSATPRGENLCRTQRETATVPLWIPKGGRDPSGRPFVTVTCPECLRPFTQTLGESDLPIQETGCIYCSSPVHFAIVQTAEAAYLSPPLSMQG